MQLSWEEKKDIRRQLTQDLGRTPTDDEFDQELRSKHANKQISLDNILHPIDFLTEPLDTTSRQIDREALDDELKKEKEQGKNILNSGNTEKLLNLKPLNDTNNFPSLDREKSNSMHDLLQVAPYKDIQIPLAKDEQQVKLPTEEEQLRDIYNRQGDFNYNKRSPASSQNVTKQAPVQQTPTSLEDDEFKKASQQADYNQAQARLMSAVGGLSTSLANLGNIGTPIDNKFKEGTDDLLKHAGDPLTRLKEKRAMYEELIKNRELEEDRNPSSKKSIAYRELAKGLGMQVRGDETAADLAKLINVATQKYQSDQAKEDRSLRYAELKADKDERKKMRMEDFTKGIRKEITTSKSYESALAGKRITSTLQDFSKNPTGYSDYGTLMGALRSLQGDDSVIREAEIRLGMGAGSLMDKIQNEWSKAVSGKMLTTKQRNDIINAAKIMAKEALNNFKVHSQPSLTQAEKLGIPKQEILPELESEVSTTEFPRTVKKEGKIATVKNQQELKEALAEGWQ
jgi:hypothetical protein